MTRRTAELVWEQCMHDQQNGCVAASEALEHLLTAAQEEVVRTTVERCALKAQSWAEYYPVAVFSEDGASPDCESARWARHTVAMIVKEIRGLLEECDD